MLMFVQAWRDNDETGYGRVSLGVGPAWFLNRALPISARDFILQDGYLELRKDVKDPVYCLGSAADIRHG